MKVDFLYGVWHDVGGIEQGIETYAPQNRFKKGFENTSRAERVAIFHQINVAVHNSGRGLSEISYFAGEGIGSQTLLRRSEVVHLQDVANLIDAFKWLPLVSLVAWVVLVTAAWRFPLLRSSIKSQAFGLLGLGVAVGALLLIAGPETVFNTLHVWIFPAEHEWFFYYQDSLMSTMMLAPVLFGWIAAALGVFTVFLYVTLSFSVAGVLSHLSRPSDK